MAGLPAAHVVIDDAHLHPVLRLVDERIGHQPPQRVILNNIHVKMYMMARLTDVLQQLGDEGIAVGHQVQLLYADGQ